LIENREDMWSELLSREAGGPTIASARADLSKVTSAACSPPPTGAGQGLHTRGNFEGCCPLFIQDKWLEVHGGSHWAPFYYDYGRKLQLDFFDHF